MNAFIFLKGTYLKHRHLWKFVSTHIVPENMYTFCVAADECLPIQVQVAHSMGWCLVQKQENTAAELTAKSLCKNKCTTDVLRNVAEHRLQRFRAHRCS